MIDISSTNSAIRITTAGMGSITITRFSDEGTPFEFNEIEVTGSALSLNGELIVWSHPVAYAASITVLPLSMEDIWLQKLLRSSRVQYNPNGAARAVQPDEVTITDFTLSVPNTVDGAGHRSTFTRFGFSNGRIVSGPTAPSTNPEGRLSSRTYTFVFERSTGKY